MRIYRMTATFGKLEHETLTLQPGLNVIEAPNEWGKSTWCAFLLAMFYGLDTRAKSTKAALADKERYSPWSGSPMSGRVDLCWQGRDITIERTTRGRIPMGIFRAYETETGLEVPDLTAANCGQCLLGVEQSVFRRAGFIRQADMPVTKDDALRRRLNALVTTGDESGDGERLARQLRELKNRCRYNKTGLLPQAQERLDNLQQQLAELDSLDSHSRKLKQRLSEEVQWFRQLENHRTALEYAAAETDAARVAEIREARDRAEEQLLRLEKSCENLPSPDMVRLTLERVQDYQQQCAQFRKEQYGIPQQPEAPVMPEPFRNLTSCQMRDMVARDIQRHDQLRRKPWLILLVLGILCGLLSIPAMLMEMYWVIGAVLLAEAVLLVPGFRMYQKRKTERTALERKYASPIPAVWQSMLEDCLKKQEQHDMAREKIRESRSVLAEREQELEKLRRAVCGEQTAEWTAENCRCILRQWEERNHARQTLQQTQKYLSSMESMLRNVPPPAFVDKLDHSMVETERLMEDSRQQQQRLLDRLSQYRGRMDVLGDRQLLCEAISEEEQRVTRLEEIHDALLLAQETLLKAQQELQRRFAPRISRRAQELLVQMTNGRYDRLTLNEDLTLLAGAEREDVLHDALWRSDGTVDQLYFALRLAVAEELTPEVPLILDDAFIRFDDRRLSAALDILRQEAQHKQILLFTCQSREKTILS
ncbi:MAG: AAA family ATPase [Oscillospiraceae bacterium]|nr:AAA family ATPase [Oscillospiraceae bacterium]